ncbi:MAG: hypothetical protein JXB07_19010 [Anaerolineae bacterium]|nr:hypothetical protein [Anaerolineae bacterium]
MMTTDNKARIDHSRLLITASLDLDRLPLGCDRCELRPQCSKLPADVPVLCELDDDLAGVDWARPDGKVIGNKLIRKAA